jgi:hypothetical protein
MNAQKEIAAASVPPEEGKRKRCAYREKVLDKTTTPCIVAAT